jgi:hypothetical protein
MRQQRPVHIGRAIAVLSLLLAAGSLAVNQPHALASPEQPQAAPNQNATTVQILRAPDWRGGVEASDGECGVTAGEYSYWVYATATKCGVPREQADRVVSIRQPIPGMAPLSARATLPEGRYAVWVYGAGQPGHPWVILCGKDCAYGELPPTPAWAMIGWVELRDKQGLLFRTYRQPDGHRLDVQVVVLSASGTQPDWVP